MKVWFITLALSLWLSLVSLPGAGAPEAAPKPLPFNPETIETVRGIVVDAPALQKAGLPEMERLTLKTEGESLLIILAPNWYLAKQDLKISALDPLEVTGSRVLLDGKAAIVAQKVKKGDQVMELRDQAGRPRWSPSRP